MADHTRLISYSVIEYNYIFLIHLFKFYRTKLIEAFI